MIYFSSQQNFSLQCGRKSYTTQDLDRICQQLSQDCINPHRCCCGGDYDANVLMYALQKQQYDCQWQDNRCPFQLATQNVCEKENLNSQTKNKVQIMIDKSTNQKQVLGYLVNIKVKGCLSYIAKCFCISSRHWLVVKKINSKYYILDSKNKKPIELGSAQKAQRYLQQQQQNQAQIIKIIHMP